MLQMVSDVAMSAAVKMSMYAPMAWNLKTFLENAKNNATAWGGVFVGLMGIIMILFAVWLTAKHLMSQGRSQTSWGTIIILFIVGGFATGGGLTLITQVAEGGKQTIEELGQVIIPYIQLFGK